MNRVLKTHCNYSRKDHFMKSKVKKITVILTIFLFFAVPNLNKYANKSRRDPGYGGECIMWLMPGLLYTLGTTMIDLNESFKER